MKAISCKEWWKESFKIQTVEEKYGISTAEMDMRSHFSRMAEEY